MFVLSRPRTAPFISALLLASLCAHGGATAAATADVVGEVTMVIGSARVVSASGQSQAVDRGTAIRVGDHIETQAGGHVHLRFVDGGRVSVRPSSRLQIENYSHSADQPALNAIRFRLDEGVVRSITGAWGEAARDKFRLNTPVAAIGVKGTDFVARSRGGVTFASVYTGAITLTPLAGGCQSTLGPCLNGAEKLLSEDMKGQTLELARQQVTAQIVPSVELLAQSSRATPSATGTAVTAVTVATAARASSDTTKLSEGESDTAVAKTVAAEQRTTTALAVALLTTPPPATGGSSGGSGSNGNGQGETVLPPPVSKQMTWARVVSYVPETYESLSSPPKVTVKDSLSIPFVVTEDTQRILVDPSKKGWEYVAPTSLLLGYSDYRIFRDPGVGATPTTDEAKATFRLASAEAGLFKTNGSFEAAKVLGDKSSLTIDFVRSTYSTLLTISNDTLGTFSGSDKGTIDKATGTMSGTSTEGAFSRDRTEAAYYFSRTLSEGQLKGITLWGR